MRLTLCLAATFSFAAAAWPQGETAGEADPFRVETQPVAGGAELITIFAKTRLEGAPGEIPMLSVLKDTLGDDRVENDRLRSAWMLTYRKPSFWQKAASYVPFLYTRVGSRDKVGDSVPPPIADINGADHGMWNTVLWYAFRKVVLSQAGIGPRSSALQSRQNAGDYRRSAIAEALALLEVYQKVSPTETVLSQQEIADIRAKLWLTDKPLGSLMQDENLERFLDKKQSAIEDTRGHNWELLRQYTEAQGLYFEPLAMPDGSATHAIVWTTAEDVASNAGRKFQKRFLNIKSPWDDPTLRNWSGFTQKRYFRPDGSITSAGDPTGTVRTMIPLAVYGLDTSRIPGILIDFRNDRNAKRREISRRVLNDITGNVLSVSRFTNLPYLLGRTVFDFATGRRGTDINQASRLRSYSQLKTLIALDQSLDPELSSELAGRIEDVAINPLENDVNAEARIAQKQYENLLAYARRPDGLPARLDRDRREEMVKFAHSGRERTLLNLAHALTFGLYTHRESKTPVLVAKMETGRMLEYHERVLNELAFRSVDPEVDSDPDQLRSALLFLAENGAKAKPKTAKSLAKVFNISGDEDIRRLCIVALYRVDNSAAKSELLAIHNDLKNGDKLRDLSAQFLKQSVAERKRISPRTAAGIAELAVN